MVIVGTVKKRGVNSVCEGHEQKLICVVLMLVLLQRTLLPRIGGVKQLSRSM